MIDGFKISVKNVQAIERLIRSEKITFEVAEQIYTGEVKDYPKIGQFRGLICTVRGPANMEIRGSLHKFYSDGVNHTDFNFKNVVAAIENLSNELCLAPSMMHIQNLEFGVNVTTVNNPTDMLKDVICYKNRMPINPINDNRGYLIEFRVNGYYFKMYDKGKQYKLKENLLRVEVKGMTNRFLFDLGVSNMADVMKHSNFVALQEKLLSLYKHVVFDDSGLNIDELNIFDRKVYEPLKNPKLWVKIKGAKNQTLLARERRFKDIVSKWGKYGHYVAINELILKKSNQLLKC